MYYHLVIVNKNVKNIFKKSFQKEAENKRHNSIQVYFRILKTASKKKPQKTVKN